MLEFRFHVVMKTVVCHSLLVSAHPLMLTSISIRKVLATDDMTALTELLHAAYTLRAAANLRCRATHQTPFDTASRFAQGQGFVAEISGKPVGTITVRPSNRDSPIAFFREPNTWTFCQFGVLPEFRGAGIGRKLHSTAVSYAAHHGGKKMCLDTAAPAKDLIDMYLRWGYTIVGEADWRPTTNYLSIVMLCDIAGHAKT